MNENSTTVVPSKGSKPFSPTHPPGAAALISIPISSQIGQVFFSPWTRLNCTYSCKTFLSDVRRSESDSSDDNSLHFFTHLLAFGVWIAHFHAWLLCFLSAFVQSWVSDLVRFLEVRSQRWELHSSFFQGVVKLLVPPTLCTFDLNPYQLRD